MKTNDLYKMAYDLLKEDGFIGFYLIKDIGDSLVFFGGNPNEAYYGVRSVCANKNTGEVKWFPINDDNYDLIERSPKMTIPNEYNFKAS